MTATVRSLVKLLSVCTASLLLLGGVASAATTAPAMASTGGPLGLPVNTGVTLPLFNEALGTLESVMLTLSANASGDIEVFDTTAAAQNYSNASATITINVTGPNGTVVPLTLFGSGASGTVGANSIASTPIGPVSSNDVINFSTGLSAWEAPSGGTQFLPISFNTNGTYSGTSQLGVFFGGDATGLATLSVVYTYNPVAAPEPASVALFALALAALAALAGYRWRTLRRASH